MVVACRQDAIVERVAGARAGDDEVGPAAAFEHVGRHARSCRH